jgi:hypothetical protein
MVLEVIFFNCEKELSLVDRSTMYPVLVVSESLQPSVILVGEVAETVGEVGTSSAEADINCLDSSDSNTEATEAGAANRLSRLTVRTGADGELAWLDERGSIDGVLRAILRSPNPLS